MDAANKRATMRMPAGAGGKKGSDMELLQALQDRYSVRAFTDEVPTQEQIQAVLEAGHLAPTAANKQPQRIYVVTGEENLAKIDECTRCRFNAPVVFILGYSKAEARMHDGIRLTGEVFSFGDQDMTSALVHMALRATDLGLGTCWLGAIADDKAHELFDVPEDVAIRAFLDFGVPDPEKAKPSVMHSTFRPMNEVVTWLSILPSPQNNEARRCGPRCVYSTCATAG